MQNPDCCEMEFVRILTYVSHVVAYQFESNTVGGNLNGKKQMPAIVSTLTKELYIH